MQIDPIEYDLLLYTLEKQQKEIKRLRNRADFEEPKVFTTKNQKHIELSIPTDNWTCQHFIRYFLQRYRAAYGKNYSMQPSAFKLEAFKITHFWQRHKDLTKTQFKDMIDWLFETVNENYELKMGLMTNDKQLENFKKSATKNKKDEYNINEEELREAIKKQPKVDMTTKEVMEKLRKAIDK